MFLLSFQYKYMLLNMQMINFIYYITLEILEREHIEAYELASKSHVSIMFVFN